MASCVKSNSTPLGGRHGSSPLLGARAPLRHRSPPSPLAHALPHPHRRSFSRSHSHWSALRGKLFPLLRLAKPAAVTGGAAGLLAFAAHGTGPGDGAATAGSSVSLRRLWRGPLLDSGLAHDGRTLQSAGSSGDDPAAAAAVPSASLSSPLPGSPLDLRTCRGLLAEHGYGHPGLQPGAQWGAMRVGASPSRSPARVGAAAGLPAQSASPYGQPQQSLPSPPHPSPPQQQELHAMFEYLLLFPA